MTPDFYRQWHPISDIITKLKVGGRYRAAPSLPPPPPRPVESSAGRPRVLPLPPLRSVVDISTGRLSCTPSAPIGKFVVFPKALSPGKAEEFEKRIQRDFDVSFLKSKSLEEMIPRWKEFLQRAPMIDDELEATADDFILNDFMVFFSVTQTDLCKSFCRLNKSLDSYSDSMRPGLLRAHSLVLPEAQSMEIGLARHVSAQQMKTHSSWSSALLTSKASSTANRYANSVADLIIAAVKNLPFVRTLAAGILNEHSPTAKDPIFEDKSAEEARIDRIRRCVSYRTLTTPPSVLYLFIFIFIICACVRVCVLGH